MHGQAARLKQEIETKLAGRAPSALSPLARQAPRLCPVGHARLDRLLGGGLPLGSVCELTGAAGSGRSSLALSLLAGASGEAACAYIDASNAFSPRRAASAGVDLGNLLWVHFGPPAVLPMRAAAQAGTPMPARPDAAPRPTQRGGPHPRGETKDLAPALERVLLAGEERRQWKAEGTPGSANQPLGLAASLSAASPDQIAWERCTLRKPDEFDPLRLSEREAARAARQRAAMPTAVPMASRREPEPWDRLGRALRAADQVLQSGGFRVVVLDLASVAPGQALRIPSATWFRFRRAAQESDAILLLLTQELCARSSAACVLKCRAAAPSFSGNLLTGAAYAVEIARQRTGPAYGKAPERSAAWSAAPPWMRAVGA